EWHGFILNYVILRFRATVQSIVDGSLASAQRRHSPLFRVSLYSPIILWSPEYIFCFREIICSIKAADIDLPLSTPGAE
ncbi:MAG: hypothetical protein PVI77_23125, partial [Desulfobacterales bacterium]